MRVIVLGGYGNFGARICRAIARDPNVELMVAGRDGERAAAFARSLTPSQARAVELNTNTADFAARLAALRPELVIHTAGPFQGQDYAVAQAVAQAGAHYIDLADGRRFVCDFSSALDRVFKTVGRVAISGASTVPALSSAVVDTCRDRFAELRGIELCIAPAQQAPRGEATLAGVLSYCGEPVRVWQQGRWQIEYGWAAPQLVRFAHMHPRLGALCDIPDLELFPQRYPGVRDVMFRAALEVGLTQRVFALIASLRRRGWIGPASGFAPWLHRRAGWFDRFGTALGGMVVRMTGSSLQGEPLTLEWHLSANDNHGPEIPCMAAILLARKLARGEALPCGAHPCMGLLTLDDFEPEFSRWRMRHELHVNGKAEHGS